MTKAASLRARRIAGADSMLAEIRDKYSPDELATLAMQMNTVATARERAATSGMAAIFRVGANCMCIICTQLHDIKEGD